MTPGGQNQILPSVRLLYHFAEPLSILSNFLVILSAFLVSFSSETVGVKLFGSCESCNFNSCWLGLEVYNRPSRAVEALVIFLVVIIMLMWWFLSRGRSVVAADPSSFASGASLQSSDTRKLFAVDIPVQKSGLYS
jgi:hypothetical protein